MGIYAGWSSGKVSDPGSIPEVRAHCTCWVVPPEKRLFYRVYISLAATALLIGISSAAMVTDVSLLSDKGFPPYFLGEQPPIPKEVNNLEFSLVSRRKSLYTVPREQLDLAIKQSQATQQSIPVARPPKKAQQCTEKSASLGLCQLDEAFTRKNLVVKSEKREKGPAKKSKFEGTLKKRKSPPRRDFKSSEKNDAAFGQGMVGLLVVLLCLLAIRPYSPYLLFDFGLSNAAAIFAFARLQRWRKSQVRKKKVRRQMTRSGRRVKD